MRTIQRVAFGISSDEITSEEIRDLIGIIPDSFSNKNEEIRPNILSKTNYWEIVTKNNNQIDLHEHLNEIKSIIEPVSSVVRELSAKAEVYLVASLNLSSDETPPSIYLDRVMIKFLCDINAELGIDIEKS